MFENEAIIYHFNCRGSLKLKYTTVPVTSDCSSKLDVQSSQSVNHRAKKCQGCGSPVTVNQFLRTCLFMRRVLLRLAFPSGVWLLSLCCGLGRVLNKATHSCSWWESRFQPFIIDRQRFTGFNFRLFSPLSPYNRTFVTHSAPRMHFSIKSKDTTVLCFVLFCFFPPRGPVHQR